MAENTNTERDRAIMEGERNASLDSYSRVVYLTQAESRIYETAFTNGWNRRASLSLPAAGQEPVAHLWQHGETGRTRIVLPDMIVDADASWQVVGTLYLGAAPQPAVAAGWVEERENLRKALQFYADGEHFIKSEPNSWDTVSGEPQNYWCDEAGTATVEDGSIAKLALEGHTIHFEDDESAIPPAPSTEGESNG